MTILDVREYNEIEQGKIPNALGLPLSVLPEAIKLQPEDFERTYGFRKPKRDERVVVYCRSGKRSQSALEAMMEGAEVDNRFTKWVGTDRRRTRWAIGSDQLTQACFLSASGTTRGAGLTGRPSTSRRRRRTTTSSGELALVERNRRDTRHDVLKASPAKGGRDVCP